MATPANVNSNIAEANKLATKQFPKAKIRTAMATIGGSAEAEQASRKDRVAAARDICGYAKTFSDANPDIPAEVIAKSWDAEFNVLALELATSGNRFAKMSKDKKTATLTGYGANVKSVGKGVIEFELNPADCEKAKTGNGGSESKGSFSAIREVVEAKRRERDRKANPDRALLDDAKAEAETAWNALSDAIFATNDLELIQGLRASLDEMLEKYRTAEAKQNEIEAEAEAKQEETEAEAEVEAAAT